MGAEVSHPDRAGKTPLQYATSLGMYSVIEVLRRALALDKATGQKKQKKQKQPAGATPPQGLPRLKVPR